MAVVLMRLGRPGKSPVEMIGDALLRAAMFLRTREENHRIWAQRNDRCAFSKVKQRVPLSYRAK
jgi:hypothetical protein